MEHCCILADRSGPVASVRHLKIAPRLFQRSLSKYSSQQLSQYIWSDQIADNESGGVEAPRRNFFYYLYYMERIGGWNSISAVRNSIICFPRMSQRLIANLYIRYVTAAAAAFLCQEAYYSFIYFRSTCAPSCDRPRYPHARREISR